MGLSRLSCKSLVGAPKRMVGAPTSTSPPPSPPLGGGVDSFSASSDRVMDIKCILILVMHRFLHKFSREFMQKSATYADNSTTYSRQEPSYSRNSTPGCHNSATYSNNSYSGDKNREGLLAGGVPGAPLVLEQIDWCTNQRLESQLTKVQRCT